MNISGNTTVRSREEHRKSLPAVIHLDGSARLQTASVKHKPEFHRLLDAAGKATSRELVLNTSFNVKCQPIVCTPAQALETFLGIGIDVRFLENQLVTRPSVESD